MIRSMTLAGFVLVGLTAYAAGEQHTPVPAIVLSQNKVAGLMREAESALRPQANAGTCNAVGTA